MCLASVTGLTLAGRSPGQVLELITVVVPVTIGVIVATSQNETIKKAVNGNMHAEFDDIRKTINYHHAESGARMDAAGIPTLSPVAKAALHHKVDTQ